MNPDPLNLRNLPHEAPPADLWPAIRARLDPPAGVRLNRWAPALAALLVLGSVLTVVLRSPETQPDPHPAPAAPSALAMTRSAALEAELRQRQHGSVSGQALHELLLLETELAWLDVRLEQRPDDPALWSERGLLLTEMILRYAEPTEFSAGPAIHL